MINPAAAIDCLRAANTDELYQTVIGAVRAASKGMVPTQFEDAMANGLLIKITARALAESLPKHWDKLADLERALGYSTEGLMNEFLSHFEAKDGKIRARRHG